MKFKKLGNTDLSVSLICLGTMTWGEQNTQEEAFQQMDFSVDREVNFFDTAEIYGFGEGETTLGKALKKLNAPREKLVISTKIFKVGTDVNDTFLSRKHIVEGLRNSLKRLQLDYVDVVF